MLLKIFLVALCTLRVIVNSVIDNTKGIFVAVTHDVLALINTVHLSLSKIIMSSR